MGRFDVALFLEAKSIAKIQLSNQQAHKMIFFFFALHRFICCDDNHEAYYVYFLSVFY